MNPYAGLPEWLQGAMWLVTISVPVVTAVWLGVRLVASLLRDRNVLQGEAKRIADKHAAATALDRYRSHRVKDQLERTPWALKPPVDDVDAVVSRIGVEVDVGGPSGEPTTLEQVHASDAKGNWMLLGDPGSGKTMALKEHGLQCLGQGLVPIFLQAAELGTTLRQSLLNSPVTAGVVDELMQLVGKGKAVILIDSLDEADATNQKARSRALLESLATQEAEACRVFCASRGVGYEPVPGFTPLPLRPLSHAAKRAVLGRWKVPEAQVEALLALCGEGERLDTMSNNPLLLTLMAIVLRNATPGEQVPYWTRSTLYRDVFDRLMERSHREQTTPYPHEDLARRVLGAYALAAHGQAHRDTFTEQQLRDTLGREHALCRHMAEHRSSVGRFLTHLAERTGLLEVKDGTFSFPHRTFAEFSAGIELAERWKVGRGDADLDRVLAAATWDADTEQAAWQPYLNELAMLVGEEAYGRVRVAQLPSDVKENLRRQSQAVKHTLRPEHEATTAEVVALGHSHLQSTAAPQAATFIGRVIDRASSPDVVGRIARGLEGTDRGTLHRVLDGISGQAHWEQRVDVYRDLQVLLAGPAEVLQFLDERRGRTTHGADLYWLHQLISMFGQGTWGGRATREQRSRGANLAGRFWLEHRAEERREALDLPTWIRVPAQRFWMGSPDGEGYGDEHPRHEVSVDADFEVMDALVTNRFYELFDDRHSRVADWKGLPHIDEHPAVNVCWFEAMALAQWLDAEPETERIRLPFEIEWELACRLSAPEGRLDDLAWHTGNSGGHTHPVRQRPIAAPGDAERLPVFDMLGNAWEWCADPWDPECYARRAAQRPFPYDPQSARVPASSLRDLRGAGRVDRGGGWDYGADRVRPACRGGDVPGSRDHDLGVRLVRVPAPQARP